MSVLSPVSAYLLRLLTSRGSRSKGCGFWRVAIASGSSRGHDRVKAVRGGMEGSIIAKNTGPTEVQVARSRRRGRAEQSAPPLPARNDRTFRLGRRTPWTTPFLSCSYTPTTLHFCLIVRTV